MGDRKLTAELQAGGVKLVQGGEGGTTTAECQEGLKRVIYKPEGGGGEGGGGELGGLCGCFSFERLFIWQSMGGPKIRLLKKGGGGGGGERLAPRRSF